MASLVHLVSRAHQERLEQQERRDPRDTEASLDCKGCLVPSDHLVRRVHLVPQEPMGSPGPQDPGVRLALMVPLDPLVSSEPLDLVGHRVKRANVGRREKWASRDRQDRRASLWVMMQLHCPPCLVKGRQRVLIR